MRRFLSKIGIYLKIALAGAGLIFVYIYATIRRARRQGEIIGRAESDSSKVREAEARGDSEAVRRELLK